MQTNQEKLVEGAGLALPLSVADEYTTPAVGDLVILAGSNTVNKATSGSPWVVGRVIVGPDGVLNHGRVTVRTQFNSVVPKVAGEQIVPGPVILKGDGKIYNYVPVSVNSVGYFRIAAAATGDGTLTATIGGVEVEITPAAAQVATATATAFAAAINSNANIRNMGLYASVTSTDVFVSATGEIAKGLSIVVASTDGTQTITAPTATITCGVGWPVEAVYGLCLTAPASSASGLVLVSE